jgi:hypothetical protein
MARGRKALGRFRMVDESVTHHHLWLAVEEGGHAVIVKHFSLKSKTPRPSLKAG